MGGVAKTVGKAAGVLGSPLGLMSGSGMLGSTGMPLKGTLGSTLGGLKKNILGSSPSQTGTASLFSPQQQQLMNQLAKYGIEDLDVASNPMYQQGASALSDFLSPSQQQLEEQYQTQFVEPQMMQFQREILPDIEQRFANVGGTRSSALNQTLSAAAEELATKLASQRAQLISDQQQRKQQAIGQAFQYGVAPSEIALRTSQLGLQPSQIPIIDQGSQGILAPILNLASTYAITKGLIK